MLARVFAVGVLLAVSLIAADYAIAAVAAPANVAPQALMVQAQPGGPPPQNIETNIASLHQRLQITPGQEAQFNAVANVMRENARAEANAPTQPPPNTTAVDDLRAFIKYSEVELAGYKRLLPALEALYATMSPTQRRTADAIFRQGPGG
ncbi:MAG: Spy/CpxP family protein refolding chaperone [Stellaceae bacterium]